MKLVMFYKTETCRSTGQVHEESEVKKETNGKYGSF